MVWCHGNSFFAAANRWFWSLLFPESAIVVQDFRHFGRNPSGNLGSHPMLVMVRDQLRVARAEATNDLGRSA